MSIRLRNLWICSLHLNFDTPEFRKIIKSFDRFQLSRSYKPVTTGSISPINLSANSLSVVKKFYTREVIDFVSCIGILIAGNCRQILLILTYFQICISFLQNFWLISCFEVSIWNFLSLMTNLCSWMILFLEWGYWCSKKCQRW